MTGFFSSVMCVFRYLLPKCPINNHSFVRKNFFLWTQSTFFCHNCRQHASNFARYGSKGPEDSPAPAFTRLI